MSELFTKEIRTDEIAQQRNRQVIAALRSGNYEQGTGMLRACEVIEHAVSESEQRLELVNCRWCCLGVACNEVAPESWLPDSRIQTWIGWQPKTKVWKIPIAEGHSSSNSLVLSCTVRDLLRLTSQIGSFARKPVTYEERANASPDGLYEDSLTQLNDKGASFARIADEWERELNEALA